MRGHRHICIQEVPPPISPQQFMELPVDVQLQLIYKSGGKNVYQTLARWERVSSSWEEIVKPLWTQYLLSFPEEERDMAREILPILGWQETSKNLVRFLSANKVFGQLTIDKTIGFTGTFKPDRPFVWFAKNKGNLPVTVLFNQTTYSPPPPPGTSYGIVTKTNITIPSGKSYISNTQLPRIDEYKLQFDLFLGCGSTGMQYPTETGCNAIGGMVEL